MDKELGIQTKSFRDKVDCFLQDYNELFKSNSEFKKLKRNIEGNLAEFDAKVCFVMVVGSAKSGKSTFVNLMVDDEISPTDYLECTMVPSIIRGVDSTDISVERFYVKSFIISEDIINIDSNENLSEKEKTIRKESVRTEFHEECFNLVIKYIKGVSSKEEIFNNIDIKFTPNCSKKDIETFLKRDPDAEKDLLITVINVPKNKFLNGNVAIIDMPGIDGAKSNMNMPVYSFISRKSDFVVFIQSTVAALTNTSTEYISENLSAKNGRRPPTALIQNSFDATWWEEDSIKIKKAKEHIKIAKEFLSKNGIDVKKPEIINLGLAKEKQGSISLINTIHSNVDIDSIIATEKEKVSEFYNSLISEFSSDSKKIMITNVLNGIEVNINDIENQLFEFGKNIENRLSQLKLQRKDISESRENIKVPDYDIKISDLKHNPNSLDLKKDLEEAINVSEDVKGEMKASEFIRIAQDCYMNVNKKLQNKINIHMYDLIKEVRKIFTQREIENKLYKEYQEEEFTTDNEKAKLKVVLEDSFSANDVQCFNIDYKWSYGENDNYAKPDISSINRFLGMNLCKMKPTYCNKLLEAQIGEIKKKFESWYDTYKSEFESSLKVFSKTRKNIFEEIFEKFFIDLENEKEKEERKEEESLKTYSNAKDEINELRKILLSAKKENK